MKNTLIILCVFGLALISCKDKKDQNSTENTELKETITKVEKENEELQSLDEEIEKDIKELDELLKEVDELK